MRQNPVDFNSAVETLRQERPDKSQSERAHRFMNAQPKRGLATRLVLIGVVAAGLVVFWPRERAMASWIQAVRTSEDATTFHRVERNRAGIVIFESWRDRNKRAMVIRDMKGRVACEMRRDGNQVFDYFDFPNPRVSSNPNAVRSGIVMAAGKYRPEIDGDQDTIAELLHRKDIVVISKKDSMSSSGEVTVYKLTTTEKGSETLTVDVDKATGRVQRIIARPSGNLSILEYPATIDQSVFAPVPQTVQGLTVFEVRQEIEQARATLSRPMATIGGVTLRLVLLDASGNLWVLWTGAAPDGRLSRPFQVSGVRLGQAFAPSAFTSGFAKDPYSRPSSVTHTRLQGMAREAKSKIGSTVDLRVPGPHGFVDFKGVAVQRIRELHDLGSVLGLYRTANSP